LRSLIAVILGSGGLVPASAPSGPAAGLPARGYAFVVVSLRYLVVGAWAAAVVLAIVFLPPLSATSSGGLSALIPPGSVLGDLGRISLAIMLVTLVLLALFLRSLLAPVYLLAASVLAVFATLGLTILIGQHVLGYDSLVYFVPFAAGVLLVSLGSDYNVFMVGRIWEEARRRPVSDAVAVAVPQASRAITTAGVALAASFAMLAVIPLEQFRQIAIATALGVVLDAVVVRSLLVPALVALFGRPGMWPGNRRVPPAPPDGTAARRPAPAGGRPTAVG
jgi:putative drug exporter of the RND superfamily